MAAINYPRHFVYLALAAIIEFIVLWSIDRWTPRFPDVLASLFTLNGLLHATALVLALTVPATWSRRVVFVAIAAMLSSAAPFTRVLLPSAVNQLLGLAFPSAVGAAAYWYLVRLLWIRQLTAVSLLRTVVLCTAVTVTWEKVNHGLWYPDPLPLMVHTLCWWLAFSFSLYLSERIA
jgi:hypothetical protein